MIIYNSTETNFNNNGLGFLTDVINASVIDQLNGEYSLTFEYPLNAKNNEYLIEDNIVKCKVADGSQQLFIITNVVKTYKTIKVMCKHIFYKLLYNFLEDVYPQELNCADYLNWLLNHTQYPNEFTGYSDISLIRTGRYVRKNPIECILGDDNSMVNLFGGEIKRDNFKIYFNARIGNDEGLKLLFGKNITGINVNIDISNCYTRIMPIGYDGLLLPEKYIDSPLINNYPYPRIALMKFENIKYDPNSESAYHTLEEAYQALRDAVQEQYDAGIDKPAVNISVDWVELSKTEEYRQFASLERVHIGDTITANILGMDFTTRVIKTTYNPLNDTTEKFEIGTFKTTIGESINKIDKVITEFSPGTILAEARDNATSLITQAMGGYVYKTNSELYIMDSDNPNTAEKVWRWNINGLGYSSTGINGPYGIAMTMDGSIVADFITTGTLNTNVIQGYDSLVIQVTDNTGNISTLTQTVNELNSKIQDVLDITTSGESDVGLVTLYNINGSEPIMLQVHPINVDLTNLYPREDLYPGNSLYPHNSIIRFTNKETSEVIDYSIPGDLLYLNDQVFDTFYLSYDEHICQITHNVGINSQGQKYALDEPVIESFEYPYIELTTGNEYDIQLVGITSGYLFVRLMAANIYTTQFATRSEVQQTADQIRTEVSRVYATKDEMTSSITQTADAINLEVSKKVGNNEIISKINQSAEQITIQANKVNLSGYATFTDLSTGGRSTINGANITTGTLDASRVNVTNLSGSNITGGTINGNNVNITNLKAGNIVSGTLNGNNVNITNLSASNITGGSLTAGQINYQYYADGQCFFRVGPGYANNPYMSAINLARGHGGISFRSSDAAGSLGNQRGYLRMTTDNGVLYMNADGGLNLAGIRIYDNYVHAGNLSLGGNYLTADSGNLNLNSKKIGETNYYVYANGSRIGGPPSDKRTKKNIKELSKKDINQLIEEVKELPTYKYDYKKEYSEYKDNIGIIIQDLKDDSMLKNALHVYEHNDILNYSRDDLAQIDLVLIKSLLNKIDELEEEIKNLKGGNK